MSHEDDWARIDMDGGEISSPQTDQPQEPVSPASFSSIDSSMSSTSPVRCDSPLETSDHEALNYALSHDDFLTLITASTTITAPTSIVDENDVVLPKLVDESQACQAVSSEEVIKKVAVHHIECARLQWVPAIEVTVDQEIVSPGLLQSLSRHNFMAPPLPPRTHPMHMTLSGVSTTCESTSITSSSNSNSSSSNSSSNSNSSSSSSNGDQCHPEQVLRPRPTWLWVKKCQARGMWQDLKKALFCCCCCTCYPYAQRV